MQPETVVAAMVKNVEAGLFYTILDNKEGYEYVSRQIACTTHAYGSMVISLTVYFKRCGTVNTDRFMCRYGIKEQIARRLGGQISEHVRLEYGLFVLTSWRPDVFVLQQRYCAAGREPSDLTL